MTTGALSHLKVLDLSRVLAGPWATQILADLGADVIKVERPGAGDDTRAWGPPWLADGDGNPTSESAYYLSCNRNKRSVAIDMATSEGQDLIRRLAADVDIVVENFKFGGLKAYGLDYDTLKAINPALIYCSITGFGQTGPRAAQPGYDLLIQAMGGLMSVTGLPDGESGAGPQRIGVALIDVMTGLYATIGVLTAVAHRDRTGEGQSIDIALMDVSVAALANLAMNYLVSGKPPVRMGNAHPNVVPYQDFATADGAIIVAVGNDGQFARYWQLLGLEPDPRLKTNAGRIRYRAETIGPIKEKMLERTTAEWMVAIEAVGVPCGPINDFAAVFADPQVIARGLRRDLPHALGGTSPMVASPVNLSATPPTYRTAPPLLGQDTLAVLGEVLGLDRATLDTLAAKGVI
jgi:crotonobetainyl-CoA:carnitine CoA-transferase CaiB-like acyl-CoA transferase